MLSGVDNITYTSSMIYGRLGDVLGQRRNYWVAGSNYDVTFRTINASCKQRICSCLRD